MGKTKTAFISGTEEVKKTSAEIYAEKKARKEAEKTKNKPEIKIEENQERVSEPEVSQQPEETKEETKLVRKAVSSERVRGKKYLQAKGQISKTSLYKLEDAIKLIKELNNTKFDGTFEMHLVVKKQGISANCTLPFSTGKKKKIEIASDETIEKLKKGIVDFDLLLATVDMMPKLVVFARLLGPKGLMPNPKNGTIIKSLKDADKFSGNTINLKTEKEAALIHTSFGKVSQETKELTANAESILNALGGTKQILRVYMKSTMSPSLKIQVS